MKLTETKKTLYDGLETQELYDNTFNVNDHTFKLSAILDNKIVRLKELIPREDFSEIVKGLKFQTNENSDFKKDFKDFDFGEFYKSDDGLAVYFTIKSDQLYIFSFGEKQPARYILCLEAVYILN